MNDNNITGETNKQIENGISKDCQNAPTDASAVSPPVSDSNAKKVKKKPAIRHAEKRRTSTCRFADRVAQLAVDHYKATIPEEQRPPQTCMATILAHYRPNAEFGEGKLWILSMGVGTKFLPESSLQQEVESEAHDGYGSRVRDMHAEVLARRAFRRQLTLEIQEDLRRFEQKDSNAMDISSSDSLYDVGMSVLVRCEETPAGNGDYGSSPIRYKMRPGVTLHMYTSSAPCGNATLKKFCKMSKERFREDLGTDEWPQTPHEPPPGHSIKLGEFSLLVKKNNSGSVQKNQSNDDQALNGDGNTSSESSKRKNEDTPPTETVASTTEQGTDDTKTKKRTRNIQETNSSESKQQRRGKPWPATLSDDWAPPGTTIVGFKHKGSIHTCSDKICRWNYLGLQGSLLAGILEEPLYLSTLTVGRKLSGAVCRRAICCRLDTRCKQPQFVEKNISTDGTGDPARNENKYRVNHPAVIGTSVYLDTSIVDTSNFEERGKDVRFHSSVVWTWWRGNDNDNKGVIECIESTSGLLPNTSKEDPCKGKPCKIAPMVSTKELMALFLHVYHRLVTASSNSDDDVRHTRNVSPSHFNNTLSGIRGIKKTYSPMHESFKDLLLTEHKVLSQWRRREARNKCTYCTDTSSSG